MHKKNSIPVKLYVGAAVITTIVLVIFTAYIWKNYFDFRKLTEHEIKLKELSSTITYLDEVLTMSARVHAATGDDKWEQRYLKYEPRLDSAIKAVKTILPEFYLSQAAAQTDTANLKLVRMEKESFRLMNEGKHDSAIAILFSPQYENEKLVYKTGNDQIISFITNLAESSIRKFYRSGLLASIISIVFLPVIILVWLSAINRMKKYYKLRELAEEGLRRSAREWAITFDAVEDAICLIDNEQNILRCNKAMKDLFHKEENKLVWQKFLEIVHQTNKPVNGFLSLLQKGSLKRESIEIEFNGKIVDITAYPILDEKGKLNGTVHIIRDITEQKKLTGEIIAARDKAEESNRLKTRFLQNVSHEIRTPMNAILGFMELLKNPELRQEERESYIGIVEKGGNRLISTINDIIEISKIEAGSIDLNLQPVDIECLINHHYNFLKPMVNEKGLELRISRTENKKFNKIVTDRYKLESILINLTGNAIKFTSRGFIEIGYYPGKNNMVFYVKDTGTGISADKHNSIFEPFVQANNDMSRRYEGSGLGLSITRAYVEMLKGRIWLESEPGKGSTFFFSVPLEKEAGKDSGTSFGDKQDYSPEINVKNVTVLIAEDDEPGYLYLKTILSGNGIKTIRAVNGEEVIDILKKNPDILLILMDIKMPVMDGYEAARRIREFNKTIPLIAESALAFPSDMEKAVEAGFNDYITKPIDRQKLVSIIGKYIIYQ